MNFFRKWYRLAMLGACLFLVSVSRQAKAQGSYQDSYESSYQEFYDALAPYGQWVDDPNYGYVWVPDAGPDFRPYYTNGYWAMTEYGNTWISEYDWGWAPFHYGRWTMDSYYGWVWIPGNEWGPAWVNWRSGGGYYGWAPLGPGVDISLSFGNYYVPNDWWVFAPQQYLLNPHFHNYVRGPRYNTGILNSTTVINNTYMNNHHRYIAGPRRDELEHVTNQHIPVYTVRNTDRPTAAQVRDNGVHMFRPAITSNAPGANERPPRVIESRQPISSPQGMHHTERPSFRQEPAQTRPNSYNQQPMPAQDPRVNGRPWQGRQPVTEQPPVRQQEQPRQQPPFRNNTFHNESRPQQIQERPARPAMEQPRQQPVQERSPVFQRQPPVEQRAPQPERVPVQRQESPRMNTEPRREVAPGEPGRRGR